MKNIVTCIFLGGVLLSSNIIHAQVVADTFYVPNYPIPEVYYTDNAPELPDNVLNHKLEYFPQYYYNQQDLPNCGQASGHFNCMTYEFNRLFDRPADSSTIFSPTHIFNYLNGGNGWYGASTFDSWNVVKSQGNMVLSDYYELPYIPESQDKSERYRGQNWENGYEKYYNGMKNRISGYYSLNTETDEDLKILMHYFNDHLKGDENGGTAIFYVNPSYYYNYNEEIIDSISPEYQNIFEDSTMVVVNLFGEPTHSLTLAGYCTNTFIDFNNDGFITDTLDINEDGIIDFHDNEKILWIIINSWGNDWQKSHFLFKYDLLSKIWNKQVYIPIPDTAYQPELTFKIKLKHPYRKDIKISAGISSDLESGYPEQIIDFPIWNYQGGEHAMTGVDTLSDCEILEFGIDVTDLKKLKNGSGQYNVFMKLENTGMHKGELQYFSIIDYSQGYPEEHVIIDNPEEILPITDNLFSAIFNLNLIKSDSILDIVSPNVIRSSINQLTQATITPVNGQEPYKYYIIRDNEYSVCLSKIEYDFNYYSFINEWQLIHQDYIGTASPRTIEPDWQFSFAGKNTEFFSLEQSGTIGIDYKLKHYTCYPYQTLKKVTNYSQISPFLITEYDRRGSSVRYSLNDSVFAILEQKCTFDEWDGYICNNEYFAKIYPDGRIELTYCDEIPQNRIFANITTNTNKYYIPYEQAITDTFNTVTFTPNPVDSLFTIDENGVLTMQAVSEPGKYETYVLVRDADGQEFTKRIEVNVIDENIIGKLYPNPTKDILYCDIYNPTEQNTTIEIFTITGQCVYKKSTLLPAGITEHNFNTAQFGQGVYLLKISMGNNSQTQRFVVTK